METNIVIARKEVAVKESKSNKTTLKLGTVRANLLIGLDKGDEYGVMLPWSRLNKADRSIGNLREYLMALAKDIADVARRIGE
jgi:hypothetical protein